MIYFLTFIFLALSTGTATATYLQRHDQVTIQESTGKTSYSISVNGILKFAMQQAGSVTFTWDANADSPDGYYLYCSGPVEIKQQTDTNTATVELQAGQWKCWATAYKGAEESGPSNVIEIRISQ